MVLVSLVGVGIAGHAAVQATANLLHSSLNGNVIQSGPLDMHNESGPLDMHIEHGAQQMPRVIGKTFHPESHMLFSGDA